MDIEVRLFAELQQGRFRREKLAFAPGSTVADVCEHLKIAPGEAAILMVNGVAGTAARPLQSGDVLSLFPAVGGG